MSLYDSITKKLTEKKAPTAQVGAGKAAADVMRVRATGKIGTGTGPRASTVAEEAAVGQARTMQKQQELQGSGAAQAIADRARALVQQRQQGIQGLEAQRRMATGELRTQGQMAAVGRAEAATRFQEGLDAREEAQLREVTAKWNDHLANLASDKKVTQDDIFSKYKMGREEINQREDAHELHMLAQYQALAAEKYTTRLQRTAQINRLYDEGNFRAAMQRLTLGQGIMRLMDELQWQSAYNNSAREFAAEIGSMDINTALEVSETLMAGETSQAVIEGSAKVAVAGYDYYQDNKDDPDPGGTNTANPKGADDRISH